GVRVLKRPYDFGGSAAAPNPVTYDADGIEIVGPGGERTAMFKQFGFGVGSVAAAPEVYTSDSLPWLGALRARLEVTPDGYRLWSPDSPNEYRFDSQGRVTRIVNTTYGDPLTVSYSGNDQVVTDSGGKVMT